ncbi:MAG: sporulation peptidase YabG [Epulopiscium sp. Nele67-Bin004]|nr:MAG: sporulation peptidase YabG [Epulopiscium sp. Nele67-Bin004]
MKVGDYVVRQSYNKDVLFIIISITKLHTAQLKGISYRILADAPLSDLELVGNMRFTTPESSIMEMIAQNIEDILMQHKIADTTQMHKAGKVLHIDGDPFYLNVCLRYYEALEVSAVGENIPESMQPKKVKELIELHNPDILVLTGHDSIHKHAQVREDGIENYRNTKYYIEAVKEARKIRPTSNQLVIYAGACQSHFEEILSAGADYASSPSRVLIHALDPAFIVERVAYCPFNQVLSLDEALKYTITKFEGLGGYENLGKFKRGGPLKKLDDVVLTPEVLEDIKIENYTEIDRSNRNQIGNSMPIKTW